MNLEAYDTMMDDRAEAEALAAVEREVDAEVEAEAILKRSNEREGTRFCPLKFNSYLAGRFCDGDSCAWWNSPWQGCCLEALADILRLIYEEKPNLWKE